MTAHVLINEQQRFIDLGFNEHLAKPIVPIALTQRLTHWLAKAEQSFIINHKRLNSALF